MDDLDNINTRILGDNNFQVYQGDLPPLPAPAGLIGESLPGGEISLSWNAVEGAVDYQLYRQAPGESELTVFHRPGDVLEFIDQPSSDGAYTYAIASIRLENDQEALSEMSASVQVISDSLSPNAPQNLVLELLGSGIKAEWEAPPYTEPITYSLYRSDQAVITSVDELTPLATGITQTTVIDPHPSPTDHAYVVTAVDDVGNQSQPSNSFYLNFDLLPVSSINILLNEDNLPVVSWTHSSGNISGYDIYLSPEDEMVRLNGALLTGQSYTDTGYTENERRYTIVAFDNNGVESLGRSITLPILRATLLEGSQVKRGVMNRLEYVVENDSSSRVDNIRLKVQLDNQTILRQSSVWMQVPLK